MKTFTFKKYILYTLVISSFNFSLKGQTSPTPAPRFTTFQTGQAFTAITSDGNKNVWAGTDRQGIFFMNQSDPNPTFSTLALGTAPIIGNLRIQSMAKDKSGNIWIGHGGINFSNGLGGVEKVNINTLAVQHFAPDSDAPGIPFFQRDGIATRNAQQIIVDPNNKVWIAHRYHDLTITGGGPSQYIVTPGTFSTRNADATGVFESFNTRQDFITNNNIIGGLPYAAYTYNPPGNQNPGTRICNAISADAGFVYVSVMGYNAVGATPNTHVYMAPRLLKYTNDLVPQLRAEYTTQDMRFNRSGVIVHGVYANGSKGVWATTPVAGNGFSVFIYGVWQNVNDPRLIPPGTVFNKGAIWGDTNGKVYMGTNKGIIVYDGVGETNNVNSYILLTKDVYTHPGSRAVHDATMLSNNITSGCIESDDTENFSWIATPQGIMRLNLPIGDVFVYHVKDKEQPFKQTINGKENYQKFTSLTSTHISFSIGYNEKIPSFAVDGTTSSVLRLKTDDPSGFYAPNSPFRIELRKETSETLPGDKDSPEYIAKYGRLTLKPITDYEGQPLLQDLKYVDFIYQHPNHISESDFVQNKHYTEYDIFVFKRTAQQTDETIFRHPIKLCLPPVLFGHGVWSNVESLDKFERYFKDKGYSEYEVSKAWRLDPEAAENHFYRDAHIIPTYINGLINKALSANVSSGKVNVVVHSRGGLYTRAYIEEIKPDIPYKNDINAIVTLNTPHFGSQTANAILDKRILLTGLEKTLFVSPLTTNDLISPLSANEIQFGQSAPLRIGDIFSIAAPKLDRANHGGARNLTVENDYISGSQDASTWFIPRLNSPSYRQKLVGIPIHAVATNFSICDLHPLLCSNTVSLVTSIPLPKRLVWVKVAQKATKFLLNTVPSGLDSFLNYIYNGTSDAIVPTPSMRAGLADQYVSSFPHLNICHVDIPNFPGVGVTTNVEIQANIFSKFKQNFNVANSTTNFTKTGITNPPNINYTFLAGFQGLPSNGQAPASANNLNSKIVIHPNSFTPNLSSGNVSTFDVYQENVDEIIVYITSNKDETNSFYLEKSSHIEFKNTFSFNVPNSISGNLTMTAIGFKEGRMVAEHVLVKSVEIPSNVTLQSIRFAESKVRIGEKNQHRFKLLGLYSDTIEREINDLAGVIYTIENNLVISRPDLEIVRSNIPGISTLTATVGTFTATSEYIVEEDLALKQTIVTDFFADYQQTGSIELKWKSLIEFNSNRFILEKSLNNIDFTEINQQNAQGTSYDVINYNYNDNTTDNMVYYRLRATDIFNNEFFNQTIQVNRNSNSNRSRLSINKTKFKGSELILSPNPLTDNTGTLSVYSTLNDENATLNIYDMSGKLIYTKPCSLLGNQEQKITFEIPFGAQNGLYLVQIKTKEFSKTVKLILQR